MKDLLMSNIKHKKVFITDIAIKKLPKVKFKYIDAYNQERINDLIKKVLVLSKEENNSDEVAITYQLACSSDNKIVTGICFGYENFVNPLSDTDSYHIITKNNPCAVVVMHNHPANSIISFVDIRFFIMYDSIKTLIVVTNKGKISYIIKNEKYDYDKSWKLFSQYMDKVIAKNKNDKDYKLLRAFLRESKKCGIIYL